MDFNSICRICLTEKSRKLYSIFNCNTKYSLADFIKEQFNVDVSENDGLPSKICKSCLDKIDIVYDIKNICQESDKCLRLKIILKSEKVQTGQELGQEETTTSLLKLENNEDYDFAGIGLEIPKSESYIEDFNVISVEPKIVLADFIESDSNNEDSRDSTDPDYKIEDDDDCKSKKKSKRLERGERNKTHQCSYCGKVFKNGSHLKSHELLHTSEKNHECEVCGKKFLMKSYLTRHHKSHANERNYKCPECDKGFNTANCLKDHFQLVHSGDKRFECSFCHKGFPLKQQLKSHTRIHTGEKPNQCTFCDKKYSHKIDLKRHLMLHTGLKPYKCPYPQCDRTFTKKSNMDCHIPVHTGEKPYKCQICFKEFRQPCPYKKHMQQEHAIDNPKKLNQNIGSQNETIPMNNDSTMIRNMLSETSNDQQQSLNLPIPDN